MNKTTVTTLIPPGEKLSYSIEVTTFNNQFTIPVIDVRDGDKEREEVNKMLKASNQQNHRRYFKRKESWMGKYYN